MEVRFALDAPKPNKTQRELDEAAREAQVHRFGWPIGVYLENRDEHRPHPRADGIVAEIAINDRSSYDYWAIRRNGDFYSLGSLFEDMSDPPRYSSIRGLFGSPKPSSTVRGSILGFSLIRPYLSIWPSGMAASRAASSGRPVQEGICDTSPLPQRKRQNSNSGPRSKGSSPISYPW